MSAIESAYSAVNGEDVHVFNNAITTFWEDSIARDVGSGIVHLVCHQRIREANWSLNATSFFILSKIVLGDDDDEEEEEVEVEDEEEVFATIKVPTSPSFDSMGMESVRWQICGFSHGGFGLRKDKTGSCLHKALVTSSDE